MSNSTSDDRLSRAYSERAYAAIGMAKMALAAGFKAGVGIDNNVSWDPEWRIVLYVDTPNGQVSWHIAPEDQKYLIGLPVYEGEWDSNFHSRTGEFIGDNLYERPK